MKTKAIPKILSKVNQKIKSINEKKLKYKLNCRMPNGTYGGVRENK